MNPSDSFPYSCPLIAWPFRSTSSLRNIQIHPEFRNLVYELPATWPSCPWSTMVSIAAWACKMDDFEGQNSQILTWRPRGFNVTHPLPSYPRHLDICFVCYMSDPHYWSRFRNLIYELPATCPSCPSTWLPRRSFLRKMDRFEGRKFEILTWRPRGSIATHPLPSSLRRSFAETSTWRSRQIHCPLPQVLSSTTLPPALPGAVERQNGHEMPELPATCLSSLSTPCRPHSHTEHQFTIISDAFVFLKHVYEAARTQVQLP